MISSDSREIGSFFVGEIFLVQEVNVPIPDWHIVKSNMINE